MFDLDAGKLLIIGIVALLVIPPKDLPSVMRQVGQAIGKLRRMASEFQSQFMDAIHEAELEEIRKDVAKIGESAKLAVEYDPVAAVRDELKQALGEGAPGTSVVGAGAIGAESAIANAGIASEDADASPVSADLKLSKVPATESAAAGVAPMATPHSEAATATRMATETAGTAPSDAQPSSEPAAAGQEAGARRS